MRATLSWHPAAAAIPSGGAPAQVRVQVTSTDGSCSSWSIVKVVGWLTKPAAQQRAFN